MVLGAFIIGILLSSTWLVKKTGQNTIIMGLYVIPYVFSSHQHFLDRSWIFVH